MGLGAGAELGNVLELLFVGLGSTALGIPRNG
jgi:hypothetical protein